MASSHQLDSAHVQPDTALVLPESALSTAAAPAAADPQGATPTQQPATTLTAAASEGEAVQVEEAAVGALVLVRPGDKVPIDGSVVHGESAAEEAMLTGG